VVWAGEERYNGALWIGFSSLSSEELAMFPSNSEGLYGTHISVFGEILGFNTDFERSSSGTSIGVTFSGAPASDAHFLFDLSPGMVQMLGGVLGLSVDGKPDPFAAAINNEDGRVNLSLDIDKVKAASVLGFAGQNNFITKKVATSERKLAVASKSKSAKSCSTLPIAMCAGKLFKKGDKVPLTFTLGGKANKLFKASFFSLDASGCAKKSLKLPKSVTGNLGVQISYKSKSAKTSVSLSK